MDQPLKQWLTGWKRGEDRKTKNFEYLENEKSFLKNIFHSFWRAIIWRKIEIWIKIADTSFKGKQTKIFLGTLLLLENYYQIRVTNQITVTFSEFISKCPDIQNILTTFFRVLIISSLHFQSSYQTIPPIYSSYQTILTLPAIHFCRF